MHNNDALNCRPIEAGFSLLELIVAFAVAALVVGVATPGAMRMYDSMQYRSAVGDLTAALATARYSAITKGQSVDVELAPEEREYRVSGQRIKSLPEAINLTVIAAAELSPEAHIAVIRFYPDGSSSGGNLSVERTGGAGARLDVDWLLGRVTQTRLGVD